MKENGDIIDDVAEVIFDWIPEKARAIRAKFQELLTGKKAEEKPVTVSEYSFNKDMDFDNGVWSLNQDGTAVGSLSFDLDSASGKLNVVFYNAVHSHEAVWRTTAWPLGSEEIQLEFRSGSVNLRLSLSPNIGRMNVVARVTDKN